MAQVKDLAQYLTSRCTGSVGSISHPSPPLTWLDSGLPGDGTKVRDLEGISTEGVDVTMDPKIASQMQQQSLEN